MAIDWLKLPFPWKGKPFDGEQVLLAVPHLIGPAHGGDGRKVDPEHPFTIYVARWRPRTSEWATTVTNEDTGGVLWLGFDEPTFWAEVDFPY
jgi:hypothetical protein